MGNSQCGAPRYVQASRAGSGRVLVSWQHPDPKGAGEGRARFYRLQYAIDATSQTAYDQAFQAWQPAAPPDPNPRARLEAAEAAAAAAIGGVQWQVVLDEAGNLDAAGNPRPQEFFVEHVRGQHLHSYEFRGLKNGVKYRFGVAVDSGMGSTNMILAGMAPAWSTPSTSIRTHSTT